MDSRQKGDLNSECSWLVKLIYLPYFWFFPSQIDSAILISQERKWGIRKENEEKYKEKKIGEKERDIKMNKNEINGNNTERKNEVLDDSKNK